MLAWTTSGSTICASMPTPRLCRRRHNEHTFASHSMMAGGDLYVLKSILGHKSIVMTQRYAHLSPESKRAAVNRMDNIWKVGANPH
jgi:Phage integrase family